ncbi:DNA gyrase inhibitor YacG [Paracoccus spongiarum]|uniref:DNA gyrase inhibitor YacG n=1 Tax=Paracoccus spongiarum TaxID=3064387 RepID=A0ABT9JGI0_9RHOB|nr:DNA gyrase inhibitor YacG [Paracoccus sp. 2205BS29-5]MDP5308884.1 DNA gyrase inhibitor YacG [Paracoccus sp. 2205BS29-5]
MACPICTKPRNQAYRPFCSKRCADVDLARWLRGDYVISREVEDTDLPDLPDRVD